MNIQGEKVVLRAIEPEDNQMLLELSNDAETEYMVGGWSFPVSKKGQNDWHDSLKEDKEVLRCTVEADGNAVGVVMLTDIDYKNGKAEAHIKIADNNARGKGYGTDALRAIVNYAFLELRLYCVYAHVARHNLPSQRLFRKCGFEEEGILRSRTYKRGKYIDFVSYSIINDNILG